MNDLLKNLFNTKATQKIQRHSGNINEDTFKNKWIGLICAIRKIRALIRDRNFTDIPERDTIVDSRWNVQNVPQVLFQLSCPRMNPRDG